MLVFSEKNNSDKPTVQYLLSRQTKLVTLAGEHSGAFTS